jgi:hypothetical protein
MNCNIKNIQISENINIIKLNKNSLYDNGVLLGNQMKTKIDINQYYILKENLYNTIRKRYNGIIFNIIKNKIKNWMQILKKDYKLSIDDILGFSDSLNIKDDLFLEINVIVEVFDYMCTLLGLKKDNNIWSLRILDIDKELSNIVLQFNLPLTILVNKISDDVTYISFCYVGFFNGHTSFINNSTISTFSWNNIVLKDFLKNEIPPMFHIKYSILKYIDINKIYDYLSSKNILYDAYVMLMNKQEAILYDFDKVRNDTRKISEGNLLISDFSISMVDELDEFLKIEYPKIPNHLRAFTVIYNFKEEEFLVNHNLMENKFYKIKLESLL